MANERTPKPPELDLRFFRVFSRAYRAVAEADERNIRGYGLQITEFAVLELLYHKGPQPLQEIGAKILITSGSITYVVNKLEKRGLVVRQASHNDRRVTYAVLSEAGRALMAEIFPRHARNIAKLLASLSAAEKEQGIRILKKLGLSLRTQ
ncbi:MAG: MarR family transcriptional regulator [Negativicutes bacterium]|nr:MarR family transcriptional regulator [Negativicutes bacterium]